MREAPFPGSGMRDDAPIQGGYRPIMTLDEIAEAEGGIRQAFHEPDRPADLEIDIAEDMEREFPTRKEQTMAMTKPAYDPSRYQNAKQDVARVSPFDELVNAVDELRACEHQIAVLADRLAGPQPQEVAGNNPNGGGGGLIDVVERAIMSIRAITSDLSEHHARIDRCL